MLLLVKFKALFLQSIESKLRFKKQIFDSRSKALITAMKLLLWKWKFEFDFFNKLETKLQIWIVYANGNKALILETKLRFWKRSFNYGRKITVLCSIFTYLEEEKK